MIAFVALNSVLKSNSSGIIGELDIKKTYAHINWNFLLAILEKMNWLGMVSFVFF